MIKLLYHLVERIDVNKTYISKLSYYKKREIFVTKLLLGTPATKIFYIT